MKYSKVSALFKNYEEAIRLSERLSVAQFQLIPGPAVDELTQRILSADGMAEAAKAKILRLLDGATESEDAPDLSDLEFIHKGNVYRVVRGEKEVGGWDAVHAGTRVVWSQTPCTRLSKELRALQEALHMFLDSKGLKP